jgi:hypothetical protein
MNDPLPLVLDHNAPDEEGSVMVETLHDRVIDGCQIRNKSRVYQTLMDLLNAVEFSHDPSALMQCHSYEYCIRLARANRYTEVMAIIQRMRNPWPVNLAS